MRALARPVIFATALLALAAAPLLGAPGRAALSDCFPPATDLSAYEHANRWLEVNWTYQAGWRNCGELDGDDRVRSYVVVEVMPDTARGCRPIDRAFVTIMGSGEWGEGDVLRGGNILGQVGHPVSGCVGKIRVHMSFTRCEGWPTVCDEPVEMAVSEPLEHSFRGRPWAPENLAVSVRGYTVDLSWEAPRNDGGVPISRYHVLTQAAGAGPPYPRDDRADLRWQGSLRGLPGWNTFAVIPNNSVVMCWGTICESGDATVTRALGSWGELRGGPAPLAGATVVDLVDGPSPGVEGARLTVGQSLETADATDPCPSCHGPGDFAPWVAELHVDPGTLRIGPSARVGDVSQAIGVATPANEVPACHIRMVQSAGVVNFTGHGLPLPGQDWTAACAHELQVGDDLYLPLTPSSCFETAVVDLSARFRPCGDGEAQRAPATPALPPATGGERIRVARGEVLVADAAGHRVVPTYAAWWRDPPPVNHAPLSQLNATPAHPAAGELVRFDGANSTDPDGPELAAFSFEFGDGNSTGWQTSPAASHAYERNGTYSATLAVRDTRGLESLRRAAVSVTVGAPGTSSRDLDVEAEDPTTDAEEDETGDDERAADTDATGGLVGGDPPGTDAPADDAAADETPAEEEADVGGSPDTTGDIAGDDPAATDGPADDTGADETPAEEAADVGGPPDTTGDVAGDDPAATDGPADDMGADAVAGGGAETNASSTSGTDGSDPLVIPAAGPIVLAAAVAVLAFARRRG